MAQRRIYRHQLRGEALGILGLGNVPGRVCSGLRCSGAKIHNLWVPTTVSHRMAVYCLGSSGLARYLRGTEIVPNNPLPQKSATFGPAVK
jgi:phosphoglycerate dehydrogenase-like enzyme